MIYKVLVAEDNLGLVKTLRQYLADSGCECDCVYDGESAVKYTAANSYHLLILDINLPGRDGIQIVKYVRRELQTPILMLTAESSVDKVVKAFSAGADDYLRKPFSMRELEVRVKNLLLRPPQNRLPQLAFGEVLVEQQLKRVMIAGQIINFKPKEFELFMYLLERANNLVSREQLLRHIWVGREVKEGIVDTYICNIRSKLAAYDLGHLIVTRHGFGYCLEI